MECRDVFRCLFNIGDNEIEIYRMLLNGGKKVDEIGKIVGRDRSTVQRCLKKLIDCKMVRREKRIIKNGGGYYYIYISVPPEELKGFLNECVDEWQEEMKKAIENLEKSI